MVSSKEESKVNEKNVEKAKPQRIENDTSYYEDLLLDIAWRRYNEAWEDIRDVVSKATTILGASGVILGLMLNMFAGIFNDTSYMSLCYKLILLILVGVGGGFLVMSSYFSVRVLGPRKYLVFSLNDLQELNRAQHESRDIRSTLYEIIQIAEEQHRHTLNQLAQNLNKATDLFVYGLASFLVSFLVTIFYSLCH